MANSKQWLSRHEPSGEVLSNNSDYIQDLPVNFDRLVREDYL